MKGVNEKSKNEGIVLGSSRLIKQRSADSNFENHTIRSYFERI